MKVHWITFFVMIGTWVMWGALLSFINAHVNQIPPPVFYNVVCLTIIYLLSTFTLFKPITLKKDENTCDK